MSNYDRETLLALTDSRVSELVSLRKRVVDPPIFLDNLATGRCRTYTVESHWPVERFSLDIENKTFGLRKWTFQLRYAHNIILVRLDLGKQQRHTNPDDVTIEGTHLHIWRHDVGDAHAKEIEETDLKGIDLLETKQCVRNFLGFCGIDICDIDPSLFKKGDPSG